MHKNCKCPPYIIDINKKQVNLVEVGTLRKLFLSIFALAFIFTFNITAIADEGHSHDSNINKADEKFKNGANTNQEDVGEVHGHSNHPDTKHESTSSSSHTEDEGTHEEKGHGSSDDHSDQEKGTHEEKGHGSSDDHSDQEKGIHEEEGHGTSDDNSNQDEGGHESEGHHGPVVETPPNYKVLGTYGAVNLSFILIGVWNKWFRRKENN
jgi:DNA mismatch repair ATPase MutL